MHVYPYMYNEHIHTPMYIYTCPYTYTVVTYWWFWFQDWPRPQTNKKYGVSLGTWPKSLFTQHKFYHQNHFPTEVCIPKWNEIFKLLKLIYNQVQWHYHSSRCKQVCVWNQHHPQKQIHQKWRRSTGLRIQVS